MGKGKGKGVRASTDKRTSMDKGKGNSDKGNKKEDKCESSIWPAVLLLQCATHITHAAAAASSSDSTGISPAEASAVLLQLLQQHQQQQQ